MELHEKLDIVKDEKTFLEFVKMLLEDRLDEINKEKENPSNPWGPGHNGWENSSVDGFLEAALAWSASTNFGKTQGVENNPWKKCAVFLYCGKIYE